ncbi:MAG TPA: DUF3011 domain-containing protein [Terriglobales bacterium]|nr:DUF3011 domain-containing protein [Terriglobales bacterium]
MHGQNLVLRLSLAVGAFLLWGATALSAQQVFNCSSEDGHRHYCAADTHHSNVNMIKQRSDARCQEGYSWGRDRHGVWVDHGCRADFEIVSKRGRDNNWRGDRDRSDNGGYDYNRRSGIQAINCSSNDMHRHYCAADTRGGVRLFKQLSEARCQEGYSWGYDDRGIWVDRGCRADFQTGLGGR